MLQHAENWSARTLRISSGYSEETIAVYDDLMALPYDAGPPEFYGYLVDRLGAVFARVFEHVRRSTTERSARARLIRTTAEFGEALEYALRKVYGVRRVIFLLDEAGRVLGRRFPRAFQDNLYSMLYVDRSETAERVALVLSGAQELAGFCRDETSPLGSRAGQLILGNLGIGALSEFANDSMPGIDTSVQRYLFDETGGHAGLAFRLIEGCGRSWGNFSRASRRDQSAGGRRLATVV